MQTYTHKRHENNPAISGIIVENSDAATTVLVAMSSTDGLF